MLLTLTQPQWLLLALSLLAGFVQSASPDRWVPGSLLSWQRGWSMGGARDLALPLAALATHLGSGFLLYLVLAPWVRDLPTQEVFAVSAGLIVVFGLVRSLRFPRIHTFFAGAGRRANGPLAVLLFLGPCETLFPVLLKGRALGLGYLLPFAAFSLGALVAGYALHFYGRRAWNAPARLVQTLAWARTRATAVPVAAAVLLGISALLRLR
jgi:hypothetical protein